MSIVTPRRMQGTVELLPREQVAFQNMLDTIRRGYERFGFLPVETPVMEYVDVLLTKSGGETEKQVYLAQSTGARKEGREPDLALRFDLTVPLARYVAAYEGQLQFPFRRYQMQRVYRGERAQKGRFREFYQCDVDVIGKDSLPLDYDAEIPAVIYHVFKDLDVGAFTIHLNHRKVLFGLLESLGIADAEQQTLVLREIDKLDKRSKDDVLQSLQAEAIGLDQERAEKVLSVIEFEGSNAETLAHLDGLGVEGESFRAAVEELRTIITMVAAHGVPEGSVAINLRIARGLDYYTGCVYETTLDDHPEIGSVCSGGRYENLAGHYTKSHLPGVGISIGASRLFWQLRELGKFEDGNATADVFVARMDPSLTNDTLALAASLRAAGLKVESWLEGGKMKRQLKYASKAGIPLVAMMGEDEKANGTVTLKDLRSGEQETVAQDSVAAVARRALGGSS